MQRVQKEIKRLTKAPPPGISAWPSSDENLLQLSVQMQGPPDTPYEQGLFKLQVCVPQRWAGCCCGVLWHNRNHAAALLSLFLP